jgi:hypothetical protein
MSDLLDWEITDYDDLLDWERLARAEIAALRAERDALRARAEAAEAALATARAEGAAAERAAVLAEEGAHEAADALLRAQPTARGNDVRLWALRAQIARQRGAPDEALRLLRASVDELLGGLREALGAQDGTDSRLFSDVLRRLERRLAPGCGGKVTWTSKGAREGTLGSVSSASTESAIVCGVCRMTHHQLALRQSFVSHALSARRVALKIASSLYTGEPSYTRTAAIACTRAVCAAVAQIVRELKSL